MRHVPQFISMAYSGSLSTTFSWNNFQTVSFPTTIPICQIRLCPAPLSLSTPTPAANATALTIKVWERRLADNVSVTDNLQALKAQLIARVQPADIVFLHDPFFGLLNMPALAIMTHLTELHGTLNRSDFTHLRLQLSLPMTLNESIQDFIGTHQELHEQFAAAHQPLSELDKCHLLVKLSRRSPIYSTLSTRISSLIL